ncbi:MAG: dGTP triphosphohydrolase [Phycisphaerae bacterium]
MSVLDFSREHEDPHAAGQPPLAVDRQRVIHSSAFRRLQYKTQVFVARHGDHFRSRLTHTLEVASLARTIAEALGLKADLAEVVALAHDLGHPPFGHAGERALHKCMKKRGQRFEHNEQTLRVVSYLEHPYPEFRGLNLTAAVGACLRTHRTAYDRPDAAGREPAPLEGQVVAQADQLAYVLHDLQDGLYAELLEPARLMDIELWRTTYSGPETPTRSACLRHLRPTVERMLAVLIDDLKTSFDQRQAESSVESTEPTRGGERTLVERSAAGQHRLDELGELLHASVYKDRQVVRMDDKATRIVQEVFDAYVNKPQLLPRRFAERVPKDGKVRVVADYVAGMTDRFCQDEHARLFDPTMDVQSFRTVERL